jgi:hypothetical protein
MGTGGGQYIYYDGTNLNLTGYGNVIQSGSWLVRCSATQYATDAVRSGGYIQWSTDIGAVGTNYFVSDERKKDNIVESSTDALPVINAIKTIAFDWKEDSGQEGHVEVGVSAQRLQKVNPRFVAELTDGTLMVRDPEILPYLIKAVQEQQSIIEDLKARITALEAK